MDFSTMMSARPPVMSEPQGGASPPPAQSAPPPAGGPPAGESILPPPSPEHMQIANDFLHGIGLQGGVAQPETPEFEMMSGMNRGNPPPSPFFPGGAEPMQRQLWQKRQFAPAEAIQRQLWQRRPS
jgi:hypothetical protein